MVLNNILSDKNLKEKLLINTTTTTNNNNNKMQTTNVKLNSSTSNDLLSRLVNGATSSNVESSGDSGGGGGGATASHSVNSLSGSMNIAVPAPPTTTKVLSNDDKKINLNALKNQDPFATNILDMAVRVAVYKFLSKKNEWKKLDVEGSLFIFERMVEPLHSFVVMNTLAFNLFLQPITVDLEFQDRNPFLLYKSNNDIFGIWFIDKEDCERIKSLIIRLTEKANERREKREKSRQTGVAISAESSLKSDANKPNNNNNNNKLPLALLEQDLTNQHQQMLAKKLQQSTVNANSSSSDSATTPTPTHCNILIENLSNSNSCDNLTNAAKAAGNEAPKNVDIMKLLNKAQLKFNQNNKQQPLHSQPSCNLGVIQPTSHSTPGNVTLNSLENCLKQITEPKPFTQWPSELFVNPSNYVKPEPIHGCFQQQQQQTQPQLNSLITSPALSMSSIGSQQQPSSDKQLNPILQMLLNSNQPTGTSNSSSSGGGASVNNTSNDSNEPGGSLNPVPSTQDLISLELKRQLNIAAPNKSQTRLGVPQTQSQTPLSHLIASPIVPSSNLILTPNLNDQSSILAELNTNSSQTNLLNTLFPPKPQPTLQHQSLVNSLLKKPMTVQDFEENMLLNQSTSSSTPTATTSTTTGTTTTTTTTSTTTSNEQTTNRNGIFYLTNDSSSNNTSGDMGRPSKLTFTNSNISSAAAVNSNEAAKKMDKKEKKNKKKLKKMYVNNLSTTSNSSSIKSSSSSTSTSSNSSSSSSSSSTSTDASDTTTDSDSEVSSPNRMPLLLTPAAFESSSASSTTSSSFNQNKKNQDDADLLLNSNASAAAASLSEFFSQKKNENFLFPAHFNFNSNDVSTYMNMNLANMNGPKTLTHNLINNNNPLNAADSTSTLNSTDGIQQLSVLTKSQLQKVLVHLLNNDDQFLTTLHQAYLKCNKVSPSSSATTAIPTVGKTNGLGEQTVASSSVQATASNVSAPQHQQPTRSNNKQQQTANSGNKPNRLVNQPSATNTSNIHAQPISYAKIVNSSSSSTSLNKK